MRLGFVRPADHSVLKSLVRVAHAWRKCNPSRMSAGDLQLYNTLTSRVEAFAPQDPDQTRVYVCGPTVYDFSHLGHARCYVIYDILVRHLRASGQKVNYVRNITDIDDKILRRANENGETPVSLSERCTEAFQADMKALGNLPPDIEPKVSTHLDEIRSLITKLIEQGNAYPSNGDVYFHVPSFAEYGKLSHRNASANEAGASGRVEDGETAKKKDPSDFALWKGCASSEWGWESPWGFGRPGWHIECSAMCMRHLGTTVDLHGGGLDLIFPHHENELAQSEAANHQCFARHWMHNGFVEVNKEKMSKSLGNFFVARELFTKYEPEAIRFAMLTVHYRAPLSLDWTEGADGKAQDFPLLLESERRVEYLYRTRAKIAAIPEEFVIQGDVPQEIKSFPQGLVDALNDDLNMPRAVALMSGLLSSLNELAEKASRKKPVARATLMAANTAFTSIASRLGIGADDGTAFLLRVRRRRAVARGIGENIVEEKIAERRQAREAKDFARADQVRAELTALGVELMDSPTATTWRIP